MNGETCSAFKPTEASLKRRKQALKGRKEEIREGLPHLFAKKYAWQRAYLNSRNKMCLMTAANQIGKAQLLQEVIATPKGFVTMEDLGVGDEVFGGDGRPAKITWESEIQNVDCYRFTFCDGSTTVAAGNHKWKCKTSKERFRKSYAGANGDKWDNPDLNKWVVLTTDEVIKSGSYSPEAKSPYTRCSIPVCKPVEYDEVKNLFDPYFVGLALGYGNIAGSVSITKPDDFVQDYLKAYYDTAKVNENTLRVRGVIGTFKALGLNVTGEHKFIPMMYLYGSVEQRKALLAGLMDTDGSIYGKRVMEYATTSEKLRDGFIELVNSLGGRCKVKTRQGRYNDKNGKKKETKTCYSVFIHLDFCPFRLPRKAELYYQITSRRDERVIYKIEPVGKKKCKCISVDNEDGTYLCTKNYIVTHNSTIQIIKCITWATSVKKWPVLWPKNPTPNLFWYLYPSKDVAHVEWLTKWKPLMPRGSFKEHPIYGWKEEYDGRKKIDSIHFNSGVSIFFKTYGQQSKMLQSASVYAVWADEELPEEYYDEIMVRTMGVKGYFSLVFTATIGQLMWYLAMEGKGELEKFPDAFKQQVTQYDCLVFDDGSPGLFTEEEIEKNKAKCKNAAEVKRRIYGRFVVDTGRIYMQFDPARHFIKPFRIPDSWPKYLASDPGTGGQNGHPPACSIVACQPDYRKGYVYKGFRLDDGKDYTAQDNLEAAVELRGSDAITIHRFDQHFKDFGVIAQRQSENFLPSIKDHEEGEGMVNTLFKNDMLFVFNDEGSDDPQLHKLASEFMGVKKETPKNQRKDDFADTVRYNVVSIPWDWSALKGEKSDEQKKIDKNKPLTEEEIISDRLRRRRGESVRFERDGEEGWSQLYDEIEEWNSAYGN